MVFLVYPLAVAQQINLNPSDTLQFITACLVGMGLATCLHFLRPTLGSGSLAVEIPTPVFLPTAVLVGGSGGLAMLAGMSMISGLVELLFARTFRYLRDLFPAEVCGVAVMMLGLSIVRPGVMNSLGVALQHMQPSAAAFVVALGTLATMASIAIFAKGRARLLSLAGGVAVGVTLSQLVGVSNAAYWAPLAQAPWIGLPSVHIEVPSITPAIIPVCIVMALVVCVDNVSMLVGIQRQQDPHWTRIRLDQTSGGVQVSGIGDLLCGLFGGMPTGISSANISLAHATASISRYVSLGAGAWLVLAAFSPKMITALALVPRPVVGAVMVYSAAYMLVSGMTLIFSRLLNERRVFVVGMSIAIGLTPALVPGLDAGLPEVLRPLMESPLALGAGCAIALAQLFRFGAARKRELSVELSANASEMLHELHFNQAVRAALTELGAAVGAARPVIYRAIDVTSELVALLKSEGMVGSTVRVRAAFEDAKLTLRIGYEGTPFTVESAPGEAAASHFRTILRRIVTAADRVAVRSDRQQHTVLLAFEP